MEEKAKEQFAQKAKTKDVSAAGYLLTRRLIAGKTGIWVAADLLVSFASRGTKTSKKRKRQPMPRYDASIDSKRWLK